MARPNLDDYFLMIAEVVKTRSTCLRRAVGCVLVNDRHHILATGYNGVAAGRPHCNEEKMLASEHGYLHPNACAGALAASGTQLDACQAIHAEQNALLQCRHVYEIFTVYCTTEPCVSCTKLLLGTTARRVVFVEPYSQESRALWLASRGPDNWLMRPQD